MLTYIPLPALLEILRRIRCSELSAFLGSMLVALDNALVTQSRFILLDSILVFFILASVYWMFDFYSRRFEGCFPLAG